MPWKETSKKKARHDFVVAVMKRGKRSFTAICELHGIGRSCGYRWWKRFGDEGRAGLEERSRRPPRAQALRERWFARLLQLRTKYPTWGGAKLRVLLVQGRRGAPPAVCTLERWLRQAGRTRRRVRRARRGPLVPAPLHPRARQPNDVWTIDFKGDFLVGAGQRVRALTVRDAVSRYVLAVQHLPRPDDRSVRRVMVRLFRRYGLPRTLHMDNGSPFASEGALGLSRLSVWWLQLGIRVSRSRRGCPQDNPGHEQMHGVLKKDTARPPAYTLAAQQRRLVAWQQRYNHVRPHAALGERTPATLYRPSARPLPPHVPAWPYPPKSEMLLVGRNGRAWWRNAQRVIGRAFAQQRLRLRPTSPDSVNVWLGPHLIGTLHAHDQPGLRPAHYLPKSVHEREGAAPLPQPSPSST